MTTYVYIFLYHHVVFCIYKNTAVGTDSTLYNHFIRYGKNFTIIIQNKVFYFCRIFFILPPTNHREFEKLLR